MGALIHITAWERKALWRRLVCAFGRIAAILIILAVLLNFLGPPIALFFTARWEAKKIPAVKVTAQPLADYSVSDTPGTAVSCLGYSFEVPWDASFKTKGPQKVSTKGGIVELKFDSGQTLLILAPANQNGLFTEIVQDQSMHMEDLRLILGDLMNRSAYDQYSALLNASPSTIRTFGPRSEAIRGETLLTMKAIALPASLETGAFSFRLPDKRGFQIGDPQKSRRIDLEIFDMNGHKLEIICGTARDSIKLTQPELNRILKTLHPVLNDSLTAHAITTKAVRN
jgi:hypothetical protein